MAKLFLNLTNGIESLKTYPIKDAHFIRIQSTYCEQKRWGKILQDLDYDFLMYLAKGEDCVVHDYSAHKKISRALYQGIPWIRYAILRTWGLYIHSVFVKNYNVTEYFKKCYDKLTEEDLRKINYVKKFVVTKEVKIFEVSENTKLDGKSEEHIKIFKEWKV